MGLLLAPLVLLIERLIGYPDALFRRIGHPVTWMGALIGRLDRSLNRGEGRRGRGVLALILLLGVTGGVSLAISLLARWLPFGWGLEALVATSLIAQKSLRDHVRAVETGLRQSLAKGRRAVAMIVGRDPERLDRAGVARAAIESLAESSSDGVIAPLFWFLIGGLPGLALYKAANTADSMIGHLNARYREFGWAAAKFDDLVNLIPARLCALLIAGAAMVTPGARPDAALATALRDARRHESPNAGWPEAAFAGALGFRLGGPRAYEGEVVDLPSFGDGRADLGADDIARALVLYDRLLDLALAVTAGMAVIAWSVSLLG